MIRINKVWQEYTAGFKGASSKTPVAKHEGVAVGEHHTLAAICKMLCLSDLYAFTN